MGSSFGEPATRTRSATIKRYSPAKVTVKMNDAGIRRLFEGIAAKIEAADCKFRPTHAGYPIDVVEADSHSAFPGIDLDADILHNYAVAVSKAEPFQFKLR